LRIRKLATLATVVLVVTMTILAPVRTAYAHAALVRANPANNETLKRPPVRIILNFSEAVERKLTQIQVTGKDGKRFDDGPTAFDDSDPTFASVGVKTLDPGLYFVKWSNVSAVDAHNLSGSYPFIVLNPDGTFPAGVSLDNASETNGGNLLPSNIDVALKWIALLALATVAGATFFLLVVLRPAAKFFEDESYHAAMDAGERWLINLAHVLLPISFIDAAFLLLRTVNRFETSTSLWSYLTTVRTGQYHGVQLILLAVALAGADLLLLGGTERKRSVGLGTMLVACMAALFTYSMISHANTGAGRFWSTASDFVHLVASSAWLGALVMLPLLMRWRRREDDDTERFLYLANAFDRFSIVAGVSVIAVLATGAFNGLAQVPNAHAMLHTTYGKVLFAKLVLLAPLLAVAGLNALILKPRLVAVIDGLYQQGGAGTDEQRAAWSGRLAALRRLLPITIVVEIVLVAAVFAAVGVLSQSATARGEIAQKQALTATASKFNQSATQADLKLTLEVSPNRVGLNDYNLSIQTADGKPASTVTFARLRFSYDDVANAVAPSEIILNKFADGDYRGAGAYFTQPGNWRAETTVRRSDGDDVTHIFVLPVNRAQATAKAGTASAYELPFKVFNWNEVAGAALALAGAVIILYRKQLRWLRQPGYRVSITVATALLLAGAVLAFGVHSHSNVGNATAGNPVKPTAESVARGKELYQAGCISCHGLDGRGDGPDGVALSPAPTDFRLHMPLHTDPQFYAFTANGYPGSAMPAFAKTYSETDIWNLVNYLRNAFSDAPTQ
jgi:copper transport protein